MRLFFGALANAPYTIDITQWETDGDQWRLIVISHLSQPNEYGSYYGSLLGTRVDQGKVLWHLDIAGRERSKYIDPNDLKLSSISLEHRQAIEEMVKRIWRCRLFL